MSVLLEIIALNAADCQAAAEGGAERIELCAAMALGGLTPSFGVAESSQNAGLPIMAMVRPRSGGFCYTDSEFESMLLDVHRFRDLGLAGVVFGVLTPNGEIDLDRNARLIEAAGTLETVCHRAFDRTPDAPSALESLIKLGFTRVLTSGQQASASEGAPLIAELVRQAAGRIEILPGAGIRPHNVAALVAETGVAQIHATAFEVQIDTSGPSAGVKFNASSGSEREYTVVSAQAVRELKAAI